MNRIREILPHIYCIKIPNRQSLGLSFLRFQEHYEGQEYKGRIFTLKEYKQWYCKNLGNGYFDYCKVYVGYNLPDHAFDPFFAGKFNPLRPCEQHILEQIKNLPKPFCLIGLNPKSPHFKAALRHEIAHGFWYINKRYRKSMERLIPLISPKAMEKINVELRMCGYHQEMYSDEIQAYLSSREIPSFFHCVDRKLTKKFQDVFNKCCNMMQN